MIEDEELREVYQISGVEHLQNIENLLLALEKDPNDENSLQMILREAHSLKGDSRVTGVRAVETLSHKLEEVIGAVKNKERALTPIISDRLYQMLDGMKRFVNEAVTDEPAGVNLEQIIENVNESLSVPAGEASAPQPVGGNGIASHSYYIEDEDLRDIYKVSSEEHLTKLRTGLQLLESHPDDQNQLNQLLEEAQSFELDSRAVGREDLETIIHKLEEVLEKIKNHQISYSQVGKRLTESLEAINSLVIEAVTGQQARVNVDALVRQLSNLEIQQTFPPYQAGLGGIQQPESPIPSQPTPTHLEETPAPNLPTEAYRIDTIRVPTRHLDSLMTQTGELTVTRTRLAYATDEIAELGTLWEEWKPRLSQQQKQKWSGRLQTSWERLDGIISNLRATAPENHTRLDLISRELDDRVRQLRLMPLSSVFGLFPRFVRDLAKEQNKQIELIIEGGDIQVDKQILEEMKDPLMHLIRNAVDHGIESREERIQIGKDPQGKIWLRGYKQGGNIVIEVTDDGRGLNLEEIKQTAVKRKLFRPEELTGMTANQLKYLIFTPGFSTRSFITEISGRGVGLDVVRNNVERLKGNIQLDSNPDHGCTFRLSMRSSVASLRVMLVKVNGVIHAIPVEFIRQTLLIRPEEIFTLEGRQTIMLKDEAISVAKMGDILELPEVIGTTGKKRALTKERFISLVVIKVESEQLALIVDDLLEVLDVVIKPHSNILKRVRNVVGGTILGTGDVCMIINPPDIIKSIQKADTAIISEEAQTQVEEVAKPVILLAEDSIAVRTQEKRILEKAGYEVVIAVDGVDGYNKLRTRNFDAIISDVEMPNMNGLEFTAKIRQHPEFRELPIILVTSLASEEDKRRGAKAGANAYIVKDQFNQEILLETLERLV